MPGITMTMQLCITEFTGLTIHGLRAYQKEMNTTQAPVKKYGIHYLYLCTAHYKILEMWANAQRDGHPVEHRWHPLFNAAKTRNPLKFAGVPHTRQQISAVV